VQFRLRETARTAPSRDARLCPRRPPHKRINHKQKRTADCRDADRNRCSASPRNRVRCHAPSLRIFSRERAEPPLSGVRFSMSSLQTRQALGFGEDTLPGHCSRRELARNPLSVPLLEVCGLVGNAQRGHVNAADHLVSGTLSTRTPDNRRYAPSLREGTLGGWGMQIRRIWRILEPRSLAAGWVRCWRVSSGSGVAGKMGAC
jgi:hypothetical protein